MKFIKFLFLFFILFYPLLSKEVMIDGESKIFLVDISNRDINSAKSVETTQIDSKRIPKNQLAMIENHIRELFLKEYEKNEMIINRIEISKASDLALGNLEISDINFPQILLKKSSGSFDVTYLDSRKKSRRVYFFYDIDATINVLKSIRMLKSKDAITSQNTVSERIEFKRTFSPYVGADMVDNASVKSMTKDGTYLTSDRIMPRTLVRKGETLDVVLKHEDVSVEFVAEAMQDGAKGEVIRARNLDSKKVIKVKITQSGKGEVL